MPRLLVQRRSNLGGVAGFERAGSRSVEEPLGRFEASWDAPDADARLRAEFEPSSMARTRFGGELERRFSRKLRKYARTSTIDGIRIITNNWANQCDVDWSGDDSLTGKSSAWSPSGDWT